jgi:hypothetical protein
MFASPRYRDDQGMDDQCAHKARGEALSSGMYAKKKLAQPQRNTTFSVELRIT